MGLREILDRLVKGEINVEDAMREIKLYGIEEIESMVKFDVGRELRRGIPEIVFAEHKSPDVLDEIIKRVLRRSGRVIVSRLCSEHYDVIEKYRNGYQVEVNTRGRVAVIRRKEFKKEDAGGIVGVVTAGTSDIPLAEEARVIVEEMGCKTIVIYDVGIASFKRVLDAVKKLVEENVDVVIVIAGMEGALPSVIASFIDVPVIGVPASKGYGLGGGGLSALLSMLQSCTLGVLTVNIENSVGAAVAAAMIARRIGFYRLRARAKE